MELPPRCSRRPFAKILGLCCADANQTEHQGDIRWPNELPYTSHGFLPFDFLLVFRVVINLFPILFPAVISVLLPDSRHGE